MTSNRLEQHYLRLLHHFGEASISVTLQELADTLYCTKRHMRNLLIQMQQCGWLDWQGEFGRGKRSTLTLLSNHHQLLSRKAATLIDHGRFNEAIDLLGSDKKLIAPLLRSKLGFSISDEYQVLRIPYYRTMDNLYPGTPLRRSEQHLVGQIFSGLTRIKEENGEVIADLAHHWRQISPQCWRFYLRTAVEFHDGSVLSTDDVVSSLHRTRQQPLFAHIERVTATGPHCVELHLRHEDKQLPLLLANPAALILPRHHADNPQFARMPVGTGPYQVVQNDQRRLCLQAFDRYFGLRALLDQIDILMWPNLTTPAEALAVPNAANAAWLSSSLSDEDYVAGVAADLTGGPAKPGEDMFLEQGGYFLLCDSRSALWQHAGNRAWWQQRVNPYSLLQELMPAVRYLWVPATSVLPAWCHATLQAEAVCPCFPTPERPLIRIAYHDHHPEFPTLLRAISAVLAREGIACEAVGLSYAQWALGDAEQIDVWLGTVNFPSPEHWHVGAWLLGSALMRQSVSGTETNQLNRWHHQWRNGEIDSEQLSWQVVNSGWLQPLFHHWMSLKGPGHAQGIRLNNLGWFDFRSTWLEPDSPQ